MWFLVNFHEAKNSTRFEQVAPPLAIRVKQLLFKIKTRKFTNFQVSIILLYIHCSIKFQVKYLKNSKIYIIL